MRLVRHRNSKRLSPRSAGGQFASTPSLGGLVCPDCGAIHLPTYVEVRGFVDKQDPAECRNGCGPLRRDA